ncbi:MAG: hypothetical protein M1820_007066 [Bogoriella megaspora]|nr:MAG: hypothetical protein M1820_007066 [Bogoriella megaspora]
MNIDMSFNERAEEALRVAGHSVIQDFYPAPFPEEVATVELEKISLCRLLNGDDIEAERVFDICTTTGFFYLDMLDHAAGRRIWKSACDICQLGHDLLAETPMEEKVKFKPLGGIRVFDRGYLARTADKVGEPDEREIFNVPQSELFGTKIEGGGLPSWLTEHEGTFKTTLEIGSVVANAVLAVLEKRLQLPTGSFTKLHRLNDDSGDFVRVLRYPGAPPNAKVGEGPDGFPPHKDAMSVAILFTWLGGLQIPDPNVKIDGLKVNSEDWRYVRPEPGYAIVNLGDAMEIFTSSILKSGVHRVIKAPGQQRPHERLAVLIATRPENNSLMKALKSPIIPTHKQDGPAMTSLEWGHSIIVGIRNKLQAEAEARGSASVLANA